MTRRARPTDVLLVTDCGGEYGTERCNHALLMGLQERGYQVASAQPGAATTMVEERQRVGIANFPLPADDPWAPYSDIASLHRAEHYQDVFDEVRPKAVLFSGISPFSLLAGRECAADRKVPFAFVVHLPIVQWNLNDAEIDAIRARSDRVQASRYSYATVAVSKATLDRIQNDFGVGVNNGRVVQNGRPPLWFGDIDVAVRDRVRREFDVADDALLFMTVARIERSKGYHHLLPAAERLLRDDLPVDVRFVWVGGGPRQNRLRAVVANRGLERKIRMAGWRSDVSALLCGADAFVLPSLAEGMPLSLIEAMARRLPIIATAVGGVPEMLGDSGIVLDPPSEDDLAIEALHGALRRLALATPNDRRNLGALAGDRARLFTEEHMVEAYVGIVNGLFGDQDPPV